MRNFSRTGPTGRCGVLRRGVHFSIEQHFRNTGLTDEGIRVVEAEFGCGNLYAEENLPLLTAVQDALHAHALLRRDTDYIVKDGAIESVDEFQGADRPGSALARRFAYGSRSQGKRRAEDAGPNSRVHYAAESDRAVSTGVRHDGHGVDAGGRIAQDLPTWTLR